MNQVIVVKQKNIMFEFDDSDISSFDVNYYDLDFSDEKHHQEQKAAKHWIDSYWNIK